MADPTTTATVKAIKTILTAAGIANVERGRHDAWPESKIPCARVFLGSTEREAVTAVKPRRYQVRTEIMVKTYAKATSTVIVDDNLETNIAAIKAAMDDDNTITANVEDSEHTSTEREYNADGDTPMGNAILTYAVWYWEVEPS